MCHSDTHVSLRLMLPKCICATLPTAAPTSSKYQHELLIVWPHACMAWHGILCLPNKELVAPMHVSKGHGHPNPCTARVSLYLSFRPLPTQRVLLKLCSVLQQKLYFSPPDAPSDAMSVHAAG